MRDEDKSKEQLVEELQALRRRVTNLEANRPPARCDGELPTVLSQAVDMLAVYDEQLRYTYINESGASFLGLSCQQIIGNTNREILEEGAEAIEPHVRKAFDLKERVLVLHEIPLPTGVRLFDTVYAPAIDVSGRATRVVGICRDVTEDRQRFQQLEEMVKERTVELANVNERMKEEIADRKQAEAALRESQNLLDMALSAAPIGTWDYDINAGRVAFDDRFISMLGFSQNELEPTFDQWVRLIHPDDRNRVMEAVQDHLQGKTPIYSVEYRILTKSGEWKWVLARAKVVEWDEEGKPLRGPGTVLDITERKKAEEALRESETRFRQMYDQAPVMMHSIDRKGILRNVNAKWLSALEYERDEVVGKSVENIMTPESRNRLHEVLPLFWAEGKISDLLYGYIKKDGSTIDVLLDSVVMQDPMWGEVSVSVIRDVTKHRQVERALQESEQRYRTLFQHAPVSVWEEDFSAVKEAVDELKGRGVTDFVGYFREHPEALRSFTSLVKILDVNETTFRLYGVDARETFLGNLDIFLAEESYEAFTKELVAIAEGRAEIELETTNRTLQGRDLDLYMRWAVVPGHEDTYSRVLVSFVDITDIKEAQRELNRTQALLQAVIEQSPVPMAVAEPDGTLTLFNDACRRHLGFQDEPEMKPGINLFGFKASWKDYDVHGNPVPIHELPLALTLRGIPTENREIKVVRKDGSERWEVVHGVPIYDSTGSLIAGFVIFPDITDRKRAEEALAQSEATLRTLLQTAPIGIGQVSEDSTLGWTNDVLNEMTGYTAEELRGNSASMLYESEEEYLRVGRAKHAEVRPEGTGTIETRFRRKDGSVIDVLLCSSAIVPGNLLGGMVFTVADITERKSLEEQLLRSQKMEAVGTLAGGIAHDFNNLLQVINGYADFALLDLRDGDRACSELKEIKSAAKSAAELTQSLLTFSRRVESSLRPVDLNQEVGHAARMLRRTIPKMIDIQLRLADSVKPISADPAQLQQAVMNLAVNARDAMKDFGQLVIKTENVHVDAEYCKTRIGLRPGDYVLLAVSDTGCGMTRRIAERIFEPFFTTKEVGKGTGLGLAIVYGIVQNHGGSITCQSEPGRGTTFRIYLPVADQVKQSDENAQSQVLVGGRETILLVDDEKPVKALGEMILKKFGYTVLTASDGKEGLEVFARAKDRVDLIILDLIMPGMSGREFLGEVMRIDPAARVLVASGYAADGQIDAALAQGARASIGKPYEARQMLEIVRKLLDEG